MLKVDDTAFEEIELMAFFMTFRKLGTRLATVEALMLEVAMFEMVIE